MAWADTLLKALPKAPNALLRFCVRCCMCEPLRGSPALLVACTGFSCLGALMQSDGAQEAQYVPGPLLLDGDNEVILMETEVLPSNPSGVHTHALQTQLSIAQWLSAWSSRVSIRDSPDIAKLSA